MAVTNSLQTNKKKLGITAYLTNESVKQQISNVVKDSKTFITSVVSAVNTNPALQECTNQSLLSAALLGESLELPPSPQLGFMYFVPFKNNKLGVTEAQFQISYRGYIQLAIRSGQYKRLNVLPIKEGELVKYDPLEETIEVNLIEDEVVREKTPTIGYYASFTYLSGFSKSIYWSREKMEAHALRYSKGYAAKKGYTFWEKDFDSMACKTMIRQLISKWGVMSTTMQKAYINDQAVIREDGTPDYVDVEEVPAPQPEVVAEAPKAEPAPSPAPQNDAEAAFFGN